MLVHWRALNKRHLATTQFVKGAERKRRQLAEEDLHKSLERAFQDYGEPLETVILFKYIGRVLTAGDNNWPAVASNLRKNRKSWTRMTRILGWEGKNRGYLDCIFRWSSRQCCFFGSEMWVLTPRTERALGIF